MHRRRHRLWTRLGTLALASAPRGGPLLTIYSETLPPPPRAWLCLGSLGAGRFFSGDSCNLQKSRNARNTSSFGISVQNISSSLGNMLFFQKSFPEIFPQLPHVLELFSIYFRLFLEKAPLLSLATQRVEKNFFPFSLAFSKKI